VGALKEALVGNQVELARVDLENKDYKAAIGRAERALALDPSSAEARQVLDQATRTSAELEAVALEAKSAFDAGDTDHATRALARVLTLDPRHPVAGELTAALNVHFRKQAEDARRMADEARREAEPFRSAAPDGFAPADRAVRDAAALLQRDQFAVATQKFLESRDGYERARRTAEAAQRAAAARAAAAAAVPTTLVARNVPPPVTLPPVNPPGGTLPAPTLPAAPPTLGATQEPAIRKVIADYGRAIEGRNIALFKAVKPNLTPDEEKRLQESFKAIKSQQVGITIEVVQVDGAQATVKVSRQDTINGNKVKPIQQVFRLVQSGGGWAIQTIGLQ
jgi:tetratricopeptide (TPR) repeat protein